MVDALVIGEYVDADDVEGWLGDHRVDVQPTVVGILGETREFVTILGAPRTRRVTGRRVRCSESSRSMSRSSRSPDR